MHELQQNTVLAGKYAIDYVIGAGGFGITYHAHRIEDGHEVAIKEFFISGHCVRREYSTSVTFQNLTPSQFDKYRLRFHQEAELLMGMHNEHLVNVMEVFRENGTSYMVMDYVKGETLQKRIMRCHQMSYNDAINCIAQLCEVVDYIHRRNILHRDIKPDNIMITPQNKIVLIDFGSARSFVHDAVQHHTTIVTHGYAPLEQYSHDQPVGNYTDLYAVGGVFYFLLTGQKPIAATDRALNDNLVPPSAFRPDIPQEADSTIMKALSVRKENRYQTADHMIKDLIGGGGDPPPPPPPPPPGSSESNLTIPGFVLAFIPFICVLGLLFCIRGYKQKDRPELAISGIVVAGFVCFMSLIILINM